MCEPPPPVETQPHGVQEWADVVSDTCAAYPVCKEIPGVGVFGFKDLMLKDFNGLIHLKITGKQVSLVARAAEQEEGRTKSVRDHGCHKDTDTMVLRLKLKDIKIIKYEKEFVKSSALGAFFTGAAGDYETQTVELPAGLSTMMGPFTLTLRLALDARLTRDPQTGEWSTKHTAEGETAPAQGTPGPHVCVRPIAIETLGMKLGTNLLKAVTFGKKDVPQNIQNKIYCWFKYDFAARRSGGVAELLDFVHKNAAGSGGGGGGSASKPIVSVAIRKIIGRNKVDAHAGKKAAKKYNTDFKVATQFQMPTFPFVQWALSEAIANTEKRARHVLNGGGVVGGGGDSGGGGDGGGGGRPGAARRIADEITKSASQELDTAALGEAATVLSKYLDACAVVINDEKNHATAGLVKSLANLVFDLDNDLRGVIKGGLTIAGSRELTVNIKEARVKGKVSGTRIPLSMFVQGAEAMDGSRATALLREATTLNCDGAAAAARRTDCADDLHAEASSVLVNGNVTLVDMRDVQLRGKIARPLQDEDLHQAVLGKLAGRSASALRTYLSLVLEFLRDHESDITWTSDAAPELHGLHHSQLEEVDEVSIDKAKIRFGGHFAYRGPFCLDGIGQRVTNAINMAASGIARAKETAQAKAQCVEHADTHYAGKRVLAAAAQAKENARCTEKLAGPVESALGGGGGNVFAAAARRATIPDMDLGAWKKLL